MKYIKGLLCLLLAFIICIQPAYAEENENPEETVCEHTQTKIEKENVIESTCTTKGSYDEVVYCINCTEELSRVQKTTELKAHVYTTVLTKATTSSNGSKVVKCKNCGDIKSKTTINKVTSFSLSTSSYVYNADKVRTPTVYVKDAKGNALVKNKDFKVTYPSGRVKVGKYTIKVTGMGNYSFTKSISFYIRPASTSIVSLTNKRGAIVVTYKKQSTQTTGYQVQYSTSSSFKTYSTKRITSYKTTSTTISNLKVKKYYVRVRTYKTVNGINIVSAWSSAKYTTLSSAYVTNPNDVTCLVNKIYYLKDSYAPSDLVSIGGGQKLRKEAANAYLKMKKAINADGLYISVVSSYRTKSYQAGLYNNYVASDPANAPYYSARPRTSEHELGLAIDISNTGGLSSNLHTTALGKWMAKNAYKYGFILRYPSNGTTSTGYMFEPWHYRYVGVELATKLHKSGQTLEQYYGYK